MPREEHLITGRDSPPESIVAGELGPDTPWHISRFFAAYKMADRPPTPRKTLRQAQGIGLSEELRYVYLGNLDNKSETLCNHCGKVIIQRKVNTYWIAAADRGHMRSLPPCLWERKHQVRQSSLASVRI